MRIAFLGNFEPARQCSVAGCERPVKTAGMCNMHYLRRWSGRPLMAPARIYGDDERRFWSKVNKTETCWLWTGGRGGHGYGSFETRENGKRRTWGAHRWLYERVVGPVPDGLELDHLCRVRHCVRPDHLEAVTSRENVLRGVAPSAVNARRTHCIHGHQFTADNIYVAKGRWRQCRTCTLAAQNAKYHANAEVARANARAWYAARRKREMAQCG